jgi:hypothetical protein
VYFQLFADIRRKVTTKTKRKKAQRDFFHIFTQEKGKKKQNYTSILTQFFIFSFPFTPFPPFSVVYRPKLPT